MPKKRIRKPKRKPKKEPHEKKEYKVCGSCKQRRDIESLRIRIFSVDGKDVIDLGGERIEIPKGMAFFDTRMCPCGQVLQSRFRE